MNKSVSVWGLFKIKASALLLAPARVKAEHTACPIKLVRLILNFPKIQNSLGYSTFVGTSTSQGRTYRMSHKTCTAYSQFPKNPKFTRLFNICWHKYKSRQNIPHVPQNLYSLFSISFFKGLCIAWPPYCVIVIRYKYPIPIL